MKDPYFKKQMFEKNNKQETPLDTALCHSGSGVKCGERQEKLNLAIYSLREYYHHIFNQRIRKRMILARSLR